ncbi:MAG: c-type cytochrome, partial [Rubripirellula sp.]|nr:c-type cytochrome [Rubripirellula sp.]
MKSIVHRRFEVVKLSSPPQGWAAVLLLTLVASILSENVFAEPFVIGFERFARHGELSPPDAGELLINELNCTACHSVDADWSNRKGAPNLTGAGLSFQTAWLTRYLADPAQVDPGTTMPDVLQHLSPQRKAEAIQALVAFLSSQQRPFATIKAGGVTPVVYEFWKHGDPERGKRMYHTVGCVACHQPDQDYESFDTTPSAVDQLLEQLEQEEIEELGLAAMARRVDSIPHGEVSQKYTRRSLTMMLLDPARVRPSGRMPNLRLTPDEAADIASYLMLATDMAVDVPTQPSATQDTAAGNSFGLAAKDALIEQGREWFSQLRCAHCHEANAAKAFFAARPLAELDFSAGESCLNTPSGSMPRYGLDAAQQESIRKSLARPREANAGDAKQAVRNQLIQHNCVGCHARATTVDETALGGVGRFRKAYFETVGHVDLGDEGRLPPPLTGVGAKLTSKTLAGVFAAKTVPYRTYLTIRMPAYHSESIKGLSELLQAADRDHVPKNSQTILSANKPQIAKFLPAGRQLANTGCVQCHLFAGEALPGVVGIDLKG